MILTRESWAQVSRWLLLASMVIGLTLPVISTLHAADHSVVLAWDPSPDVGVTGYKIHYGTASANYPMVQQVGKVTTATINGLQEGMVYYFAATAYSADGLESDYSNEVRYEVPAVLANQPPTINPLADLAVNENSGFQTVTLSGISPGAANETQTLVITATSSNPSLVPDPTIAYQSPNSTGTLSLKPAANSRGSVVITVTVSDGQTQNSTTTRSFTVSVNPYNVSPTLGLIADVTADEDSGARNVALSGIGTGSANEAQKLVVTATSSNPALVPNPVVSYTSPNSTGSLSFTPAPDMFGSATITVTVNDGHTLNNTVTRTFKVTVNAVNDSPTLAALPNLVVDENSPRQSVALSGIGSGSAHENQALTVTATSSNTRLLVNPSVVYASPGASGTLTFELVPFASGVATVTVTVSDGQTKNATVVRSFTVTVTPVNQAPTLSPLANVTLGSNAGRQEIRLAGISSGATNEAQTLTITAVSSNPEVIPHPTVSYTSPASEGTISFTPSGTSGSAIVTVTVNDGDVRDNLATRTFVATVNLANEPPTLASLSNITVQEDAAVQTVALGGISSGSINEEQTLTVTAVSSNPDLLPDPTVKYASPATTGSLVLIPNPDAYGTATISVTVNDGHSMANTTTRSFTVTVTPVNDVPTLDPIAAVVVNENAGAQTIALAGITSGSKQEEQTLAVTATSSNPALVPNPRVTYVSPASTGSLSFTPTGGSGTATITVNVNDAQATSHTVTRSFTVTVSPMNEPPTLAALPDLRINEDAVAQSVSLSGIGTGSANESQTLVVTATSSNPEVVPHPTVKYANPASTGTLVFTPVPNANGSATISVTVNDGHTMANTTTRTFLVTVTPVNDAPTIDVISPVVMNENNGEKSITLTGISAGAENENDSLTVTAVSSNPSLVATPRVSYTSPSRAGTLTFTPGGGSGAATVTVTVNDGQSSANTTTRSFLVTVNPMNEPPTLAGLADLSLEEDSEAVTISLSGISSGNENEVQTLRVSAASSNPTLVPPPTVTYQSPSATGSLTLTPSRDAFGTATITVTVDDGHSLANTFQTSFTVTVEPANDTPTLDAIADIAIDENGGQRTMAITGIGSGAANETQPLSVTATSSDPQIVSNPEVHYTYPGTSAELTFAPGSMTGTATITVTVDDGQPLNSQVVQTFTVTVIPQNEPPTLAAIANIVIAEDASPQMINLAAVGSGHTNEAQALTITAVSSNPGLVPHPTVKYASPASTGSLALAPNPNASGAATISVTVNDGHTLNNKTTRTFTVTVTPVNDAPTIDPIAPLVMNENEGEQTVTLTGITSGAADEQQPLSISAVSSNPTLVPNPRVSYVSPSSTGTLTFTPSGNSGTSLITVSVSDGQAAEGTFSRTFVVTVNPMNEPPTLAPLANITVQEDAGSQSVALTGITSGSLNENQNLVVTAVSSNPNLIPQPVVRYSSPSANGSLSFTPVQDAFGTATITVTVDDGHAMANTTTRSFTVTVAPVNDFPTLDSLPPLVMNENGGDRLVTLSGIGSGSAREAQDLVVTALSSNPGIVPHPTVGYISPGTTGTLTLSPSGQTGSATITVTVYDGQTANHTVTRAFLVTVNAMNEAPTLGVIADLTIDEDSPAQTVPLSGISPGGVNESQTLTITATSSNSEVIPNPVVRYTNPLSTGSLSLIPAPDANGTTTVTVTVDDGHTLANTTTRSFIVTVTPVNDRPSFGSISDVTVAENSSSRIVTIPAVSAGAPNEDQTLSFTASSSNPALVPNPTVSYAPGSTSASLTFAPVANMAGSAIVTITLNDGQTSDNTFSRTFRITVNEADEPPTINPIADLSIAENSGVTTIKFTGITAGGTGENQAVVVTVESSNPSVIPAPVVAYASPATSGTLTIRPAQDASGSSRITVVVSDGALTSACSFLVTVTPVNQRPTLDGIMDLVLQENGEAQAVALSGISSGSANESQTLGITAQSSNPALVPNPTVSYTSPAATGTLLLTPVRDTYGEAIITVTVDDLQSSDNLVSRTFKVTVNPANRPPTVDVIPNLVIEENAGPQMITVGGIGSGTSNEIQTLTVSATSSDPNLIPNPTVYYTSPERSGYLTFAPVPYASGTATITVQVSDGQPANHLTVRTFQVTVRPVNQTPTLNPLSPITVAENAPLQTVSLGGITSGAANEKEQVYVTAYSSNPQLIPHPKVNHVWPETTASLEFKPVQNANGSTMITVTVTDGQPTNNTVTRSFQVTVTPMNQSPTLDPLPPLALEMNATKQVVNLSGITSGAPNEFDVLTVTATSSNPQLVPTPGVIYTSPQTAGMLEFTVSRDKVGLAQITVTVNDGQATNNTVQRSFTVNVGGQTLTDEPNQAPTLDALANVSVVENAGPQVISLSGITSGSATERQVLTVTVTSSNPNLIPQPTVTYSSPGSTGTLQFASATNGYGNATITVQVSDGQATNSIVRRSFTVTVTAVNNPPTINDLADLKLPASRQTKQVSLSGLSSGAYNEFQALRITARSSAPSIVPDPVVTYKSGNSIGSLTLSPSGTVGSATISVTVDDGQAMNNLTTKSFLVTVGTSANDRAGLETKIKPNEGAVMVITGTPGVEYVIEYTSDPYSNNWQTLETVTLTETKLERPMPSAGNAAFFRLRPKE